jgi:hypothetical protein
MVEVLRLHRLRLRAQAGDPQARARLRVYCSANNVSAALREVPKWQIYNR